nr:hypothetical protein GCM10020093_071330 [Planobispora longispora]
MAAALDPATEDATVPALLSAGLTAWIAALGEAGRMFAQDPPPSAKPPLHARLRRSLDVTTEDEVHWCFRAIASGNANAVLSRVRHASVAAGLDARVPKRRLFLLRDTGWSKGPRTLEIITAFEEAGGRVLRTGPEDLRILSALQDLIAENPRGCGPGSPPAGPPTTSSCSARLSATRGRFPGAVGSRRRRGYGRCCGRGRHAGNGGRGGHREHHVHSGYGIRSEHERPHEHDGPQGGGRPHDRGEPGGPGERTGSRSPGGHGGPCGPRPPGPVSRSLGDAPAGPPGAGRAPSVAVGRAIAGDAPVGVELEALRRHTAIFAGSGSGKTVLIRRLVEECALQGVSAIVLDPGNDLARLGDPWPEAPPSWDVGDAARAKEYLAVTDVVVWTPGRDGGRPLAFRPLPDFAAVAGDPDEFAAAVEVAVAAIAPRVRLVGNTNRAQLGQAVLRETLRHYGRQGGISLKGLVATLAELPDGVSELAAARRIAADLAQVLTAAVVNDPLFGGDGTPVDPGLLLTPPTGKRARVSVINLAGLASDEQRQGFVNQLQMALFAWIKRNPAGERPLGGLFVMDEAQTFAPSGALTACTRSTLALASQARKYGLGLVFATQAPKGLHNQIPGNATTQFFGLLNSFAQIEAAKEMARARGGHVADVARLRSGQFYVATEGTPFVKVQAPMCLSHHPKDPLTAEEVVQRAKSHRS